MPVDPIKCLRNGQLCLKNKNIDDSPLVEYSDNYDDVVTPSYYKAVENTNYDINNEIVYKEVFRADDYSNDLEQNILVESPTNKVKRSLELVEEQPPEGTYRPSSNENEETTIRVTFSMPSTPFIPPMSSTPKVSYNIPSGVPQTPTAMPSVPLIPQPPTVPSTEPQYVNTKATNDITTPSPDVEVLETTTEDYGGDEEPNCEYDPFTWILKCGLNLITSMLGFSDTCCKPLF